MDTDHAVSLFLKVRTVGFVSLLVSAGMIFLALPRVGTAFVSLSAPLAIFDLEQRRPVSSEQFLAAEADLRSALRYNVETATLNSQLSLLMLERLQADGLATAKRDELLAAREAVERALRKRPLDAYLWTRYTHLSYLLDGMSPYTLAALERSFQYGSNEAELFRFRITLCLERWDQLPPSLQEETLRQIRAGAAVTKLWGPILAALSDPARERLLSFLETT